MKHIKEQSMSDKLTRRFLEDLENIKLQTIVTTRMKLENGDSLIIGNMNRSEHEQAWIRRLSSHRFPPILRMSPPDIPPITINGARGVSGNNPK
jgi:hypothetical protein